MDSFSQRKMFLEDTANLFSNEKLQTTRNKVVELLNEIAMAPNHQKKCENITKVQELVLHTEKDLCEEFLQDILAISADKNAEVRKAIAGFIEEVCRVDSSLFPKILDVLSILLHDISPQVVKRVIQAASLIYKNTLKYFATLAQPGATMSDEIEQSWQKLCLVKAQVIDMLDNENDGIRTNAIKFLEAVIIYQTSRDGAAKGGENDFSLDDIPMTVKLFKKRKSIEFIEALNIFDQLIKFHGAQHISSVNLIACTGSLCNIAKVRPALMLPVVEALKNVHHNLPPTLTNSQVSSVRKHFKIQFLSLLKLPSAFEAQPQLIQMLEELGCGDEIRRNLPRLDEAQRKRQMESIASASKRLRREQEVAAQIPPEIDHELSNTTNEKFLQEKLSKLENVVHLVATGLNQLPPKMPGYFVAEYQPFKEMTTEEQINKISKLMAVQMTEAKVGPGIQASAEASAAKAAAAAAVAQATASKEAEVATNKEEISATRKLRETLERVKGLDKNPNKAKAVKKKSTKTLQEITKPLPKNTKLVLLNQAVGRIIKSDKFARLGNVSQKHTKILTAMGSTFLPSVRTLIHEYILDDLSKHIDIGISWLYEEYSLVQGFIRHPYIKNGPDTAYNELLLSLLKACLRKEELRDRRALVHKVYLHSPMVTDEAIDFLQEMCKMEGLSDIGINICKEILTRKPPKAKQFLDLLLKLTASEHITIRDEAIEKVLHLYQTENQLKETIEAFATKQINYLELNEPPPEMVHEGGVAIWNEELTKICLRLIMDLLPMNDKLLHIIADVYVKAASDIKRTMLRSIEGPVKQLGQNNAELLKLIENCLTGSETLITRIIYILTDKTAPSQELVDRVKELHATKVSDVRLLIPIVCGLSKKELINALPKFIKLNPVVVKEVFNRLLASSVDTAPLTPTELLVTLHTLDINQVEIKYVVKATSLCLVEREIYTHDVLAAVLQQLIDVTPLPTLLMRTVLQALSLYPKLSGFVINLLQRLILKQVWRQKVVWDGFLKCCQRLIPASFGVIMQLPAVHLEDALKTCPELKEPLIEYARTLAESQIGLVSQQTMQILLGDNAAVEESAAKTPEVISDALVGIPTSGSGAGGSGEKNEPAPPGMD